MASKGETIPPWGVPSGVSLKSSPSITPALSICQTSASNFLSWIRLLEEAYQGFVLDMVEAPDDVAFNDPVHLLLLGGSLLMKVGHCGVATSLGSKAVTGWVEVALKDGFQDGFHHHLNQPVCQGGDTERALFPVGLRDVNPAYRVRASNVPDFSAVLRFARISSLVL